MSTDAKPAVHPAVQEHLDSFCERIDAGTTDMAAWLEHALEHGKRALHAVYRHDRSGFQAEFGTYAKEIFHAVLRRVSTRFAMSEFVESAGEATAEQEAGKLYDEIAKETE